MVNSLKKDIHFSSDYVAAGYSSTMDHFFFLAVSFSSLEIVH